MLPFRAAFEAFAEAYVDWLHGHEAQGWTYEAGEVERRVTPSALAGIELDGRIDRIDRHVDGRRLVIDYKTGQADRLRRQVGEPLEDTQLAFYAALLDVPADEPPPGALYLVLDERREVRSFEHPQPARSAALLLEGLAADLAALRRGEAAPALGEGEVCEHCEMRGLCRRDHWSIP
jgi:ATP-dependent helicase/nuclease subunit B